jgi:ATP-dependent RNA circularization protein (DNA/RNA ligase family)
MKKKKIIDRNYGSIPHLSTSKLSQKADKKISEGQENILTKKARDWQDLIIVTEKLDGSNVGIYNDRGVLTPITRSGYTAISSPYNQHHYFDEWAKLSTEYFYWLPGGWRICGEWMAMAHGTKYDLTNINKDSYFVAFDIFNNFNQRINYLKFQNICYKYEIEQVKLLHIGQPISIKNCIKLLGAGHYGNSEKPEGFVYKCEREGKVDFLAKWVRSDKEDGKYLDTELWNKGFEA